MKGRLLYQENQSFKFTKGWWILMIVFSGISVFFLYGFCQQLLWGEPWGRTPMSDVTLMLVTTSLIMFQVAVAWIAGLMTLTIKIDRGGIMYAYHPFIQATKNIRKAEVKEINVIESRTFSSNPIKGLKKTTMKGQKTLVIKDGAGLEIISPDDHRLFLGTQRPDELARAVDHLKQTWGLE